MKHYFTKTIALQLLLLFGLLSTATNAQIITTVAGGGVGDGLAATLAPIYEPIETAIDADGNIYIADNKNNRIRKVTAATGIITTVVGTGTAVFSGDGGPATAASLNSPLGVTVDAAGNIYINDLYRIRKVTAATGIISTVAGNGSYPSGFSGDGGPATAASLDNVGGVAVDAAGNIYFANFYRIQKVTASTGIISTVAGNGTQGFSGDGGVATSATLSIPAGVAVDAAGNIYIADSGNNRIRKVTAATGIISTVAGNGTNGFSGDGGVATLATLNNPRRLAVDTAGNIYFADNYRIRKVTAATGIISTVAGNGTNGFSGDGGAATTAAFYSDGVSVDASGNIYITDSTNSRIRKVTAATGIITTVAGNGSVTYNCDNCAATTATLNNSSLVALDGTGNIYITDKYRIRKVTATTGMISTVAGNGTFGFSGDGGAATSASFSSASGVAVDAVGNIYISSSNRIRKVTATTGIISTVAGNGTTGFSGDGGDATSASLNSSAGVAVDAAGNIYIADRANNRIRKVTAATGIISTIAGNGTSGFSGDGGAAMSAKLNNPGGVAVDAAGNIYFAEKNNLRIRKVTAATGIISTVAGNGTSGFSGDGGAATLATFQNTNNIAVDAAGNIYIADYGNYRIRKVTAATGVISTVAGNGNEGLSGDGCAATATLLYLPIAVSVDAVGNFYISVSYQNSYADRIRKVTQAVAPTISSFTPTNGCSGTSVTLTGANFTGATAVSFGGTAAASFTVVNDTTITAVMGAGATGAIAVTTAGGTVNSSSSFTFVTTQTPAFTTIAPICSGASLSALPTTSTNAITGTWSPALNNTATTTYTFTPAAGQCANNATMTITVNTTTAPTAAAQNFNTGSTVANLVATGSNLKWYSAATGGSVLATNTVLISGTYYVSQTVNGCESTRTSVVVTLTSIVVPTSKVSAIQCGTTLTSLSANINADYVAGFQAYRFEVTNGATVNTVEVNKYNFSLTQTPGIAYGTTYGVRVAVKMGGTWGAYGASCNVTTPALVVNVIPTTTVMPSFCGTTLAALDTKIGATPVVAATGYRFEIITDGVTTVYDSSTYNFKLSQSGVVVDYGKNYTIRVAALVNGVYGTYGASCTVATPVLTPSSVPTTQIHPNFCGITLPALDTKIPAAPVSAATGYRFEITTGGVTTVYDSAVYNFKLSQAGVVVTNGTTYAIRVAAKVNGVYGNYGASCNVYTQGTTAKQIAETTEFVVAAYPNPFETTFNIKLETPSKEIVTIAVYDMMGKLIETHQLSPEGVANLQIGNNFTTGIYNVIVSQANEMQAIRLIRK